jgi:hypothetical protein
MPVSYWVAGCGVNSELVNRRIEMREIIKIVVVVVCLVLPGWVLAEDADLERFVEKVLNIDTALAQMQLGDRSLNYTNFTIIQKYQGNPDERLPLKSVVKGRWVLIEAEYAVELQRYIVRRLHLLPNEATAKRLREDL